MPLREAPGGKMGWLIPPSPLTPGESHKDPARFGAQSLQVILGGGVGEVMAEGGPAMV
jgi:hypothetical protein